MSLITWKDELHSVQHTTIDNQHKRLVEMVNELNDAMSSRKGYDVTNAILQKAVEYTVYHFKTEEDLMKEFSYPGMEEHKAEHQAFILKVTSLKLDFNQGVGTVPRELLGYLRDWLANHITDTDKKLGLFLLGQGSDLTVQK
jgi:hemerythrin-like metal-binding protein